MGDDRRQVLAAWNHPSKLQTFLHVIFSACLMLPICMLLFRSLAEDPVKNLAQSRKELAALAPPPVANSENAALDYRSAMVAINPWNVTPQNYADYPSENCDSESNFFETPGLNAYLTSNAKAYDLALPAAGKTKCDWQIDLLNQWRDSRNLGRLRELATILCSQARQKAHKGDHRGAAQDLARVRKLAQHLWSKPIPSILMCVVAGDFQEQANITLQGIVVYDPPASQADVGFYVESMGENWDPFEKIQSIIRCESGLSKFYMDAIDAGEKHDGPFKVKDLPALTILYQLNYSTNRKNYVRVTDKMAQYAQNHIARPSLTALKKEVGIIDNDSSSNQFLNTRLWRVIDPCETILHRADKRQCVRTGLAVLQYRIKYGRNPQALQELVPEFLPVIPECISRGAFLKLTIENKEVEWTHMNDQKSLLEPGTVVISDRDPKPADESQYPLPNVFYVPSQMKAAK